MKIYGGERRRYGGAGRSRLILYRLGKPKIDLVNYLGLGFFFTQFTVK